MTDENLETLTVPQLAEALKIHERRAYLLCSQGVFPIVKLGRSVRIRKVALAKWLEENERREYL